METNATTDTTPLCETEDAANCIWDAQTQGNGEGQSFIDIDGTAHYFDYTDVYANDGFIVDCGTEQTTHWFEQVVVGFKEEADGTVNMVDLGNIPEYYEEVTAATTDELAARCDITLPVVDETVPELVEFTETEIAVPVTEDHVPAELAETGGAGMLVGAAIGVSLLVAGIVVLVHKKIK